MTVVVQGQCVAIIRFMMLNSTPSRSGAWWLSWYSVGPKNQAQYRRGFDSTVRHGILLLSSQLPEQSLVQYSYSSSEQSHESTFVHMLKTQSAGSHIQLSGQAKIIAHTSTTTLTDFGPNQYQLSDNLSLKKQNRKTHWISLPTITDS